MSDEDINRKKAEYQLEWDLRSGILSELEKDILIDDYFNYNDKINEVYKYLYYNKENVTENYEKILDRLENPITYSVQINPEIERYHALNNWLGEAYQLTSVGTFIAHPGDPKASTIYNYEYRNFGQ